MALYDKQFSPELNFPSNGQPKKTLIIASTPRCGSHMLGHSLYETQSFGFPLEYFQHANLNEWKRILNTKSLDETIQGLQNIRTSPNGVFGLKLHYTHISQFGSFSKVLNSLVNPYFVLLTRRNTLKQAISYYIASQTGVWIEGQRPNNIQPKYNFEEINKRLNIVLKQNTAWRYLLLTHNCNFIEVDFDHAKNNIKTTIDEISSFMDVKLIELSLNKPSTRQQQHSINSEWAERFIKDFDGREPQFLNETKSQFSFSKKFHNILSKLKLS